MKSHLAQAAAAALVLSQFAGAAAYAEAPTQFRTVEPRTFTTSELQQYGLSAADAAQVQSYQDQGYQVAVLTPEEAEAYQAGQFGNTNTMWLVLGAIVLVVVVAAAVD